MREKIVVGVVSFIAVVTIGLAVLLMGVSPVQIKHPTFSSQVNQELSHKPEDYVNANATVLKECVLVLDQVDWHIIGVYPACVEYRGVRYDFQIMIEDKKMPVIALKDKNSVIKCFVGAEYHAIDLVTVQDDSETTVYFEDDKDNQSEKIFLTTEGSFDYYIVAEDSSHNRSSGIRVRFEVSVDRLKPTFSGVSPVVLSVGEAFDPMEGVTAIDNADGDITYKIVVTGTVDTQTIGEYELSYSVSDAVGNMAYATRQVVVTESGVTGQTDVGNGPFLTSSEISARDEMVANLLEYELDYFDDLAFLEHLNSYLISDFSPSEDDDSSYAVIVKQRGNRAAMARAVKVILDQRGIENVIVFGSDEEMVWNIVKLDNTYRHLDVYANAVNEDDQSCFLLTTSMLDKAHAYDTSQYPSCE